MLRCTDRGHEGCEASCGAPASDEQARYLGWFAELGALERAAREVAGVLGYARSTVPRPSSITAPVT
jgi:hypothetical protein